MRCAVVSPVRRSWFSAMSPLMCMADFCRSHTSTSPSRLVMATLTCCSMAGCGRCRSLPSFTRSLNRPVHAPTLNPSMRCTVQPASARGSQKSTAGHPLDWMAISVMFGHDSRSMPRYLGTQSMPSRRMISSTCGRPSARYPAAAMYVVSRSAEVSTLSTTRFSMNGVMSAVTHWQSTSVRYAASVMPLMSAITLR